MDLAEPLYLIAILISPGERAQFSKNIPPIFCLFHRQPTAVDVADYVQQHVQPYLRPLVEALLTNFNIDDLFAAMDGARSDKQRLPNDGGCEAHIISEVGHVVIAVSRAMVQP